ncbi:DUF2637 domain-containing protein [Streptomyces sp. B1866]|uniref:DUF2637 domain-containing protein n=1 Tax=Streptomyces sp. B1866 TaxID=3075431 RepID=UPI00288E3493|nr:DUF2637 domain-containing protein [Streptomyces sp. B1866]MDT3396147.1 DUF2637 domain-containing protein [Streptomyces sp. B1866]
MNRRAKVALVGALVAVVGMAFRVSWNALRDVARAVGADSTAALLYPFVVDGLMALALVATLTLTGEDRRFALRVLAAYTAASLVLNYVHGMVPALHHPGGGRMRLADWAPANWVLVLLATSLPVGSIFFGSDLVAKVLHHRPDPAPDPSADTADADGAAERTEPVRPADSAPVPAPSGAVDAGEGERTARRTGPAAYGVSAQAAPRTPAPARAAAYTVRAGVRTGVRDTRGAAYEDAELERTRQRAEQVYAESLDAGRPIGPAALGREFGFSEGWGRKRIKAVEARRTTTPAAAQSAAGSPHLVGASGDA